jgi:hypothetical protein
MSEQDHEDIDAQGGSITNVLIEAARKTLGNSVELIFGPKRVRAIGDAKADTSAYAIRRVAEAKAYEIVTLEQAKLEAEALRKGATLPILDRAKDRIVSGEILKQENIENVLTGAVAAAEREKSGSEGRPIDLDWMLRFLDAAGFVSNQQLQRIWSKILLRQAALDSSGISIMTLDCLRLLDAELATIFLKAASLLSYISVISDANLVDIISKYPMPERTHLDRLQELGLLQYREKEKLILMIGEAFCVLDPKCFDVIGPPPRFFTLSIRGLELASALIKDYQAECDNARFALEHFSPEQLRKEISLLFLNSVGPNLTTSIYLELPKDTKITLTRVAEYKSGGDATYLTNRVKPPLNKMTEKIMREFLTKQIIWKKRRN